MDTKESAWEFRRRRVVELISQGESIEIIARILEVSRPSIRSWIRRSRDGQNVNPGPTGGRPRRLSDFELNELKELLWSRGCQVSVEWDAVASELNLDRGHGRLLQAWDLVPNDLLSVSRS